MRLRNILFLFVLTFFGFGHGYAQSNASRFVKKEAILESTLTYHSPSNTIESLLTDLSKQFDLKFTYINNELPLSQSRSIDCNGCKLNDVLNGLFSDGSVEYIPILSQILLKKKEERLEKKDSTVLPKNLNTLQSVSASKPISDSIQIIVIKRGILTKRKKQGKYIFTKGKLDLDYFTTFVEYEEIYSFVYDTLGNRSDTTLPNTKSIKSVRTKNTVIKQSTPYWKISLSASFGSGIAYRAVSGTAQANDFGGNGPVPGRSINVGTNRDSIESYKINYFGGLALDYNINKMFLIKAGLGFTNLGEKGAYYSKEPFRPPFNNQQNPSPKDTNISYTNNYNFLSIPLGIGYTIGNKIGLTLSASLVTNIFIQAKTTYPEVSYTEYRLQSSPPDPNQRTFTVPSYYYKEYLDARNRTYRKVNFSFYADLELFIKFNSYAKFFVSPTFSYGLNSIYSFKDNEKEIPFFYGLKGGLAFRLK